MSYKTLTLRGVSETFQVWEDAYEEMQTHIDEIFILFKMMDFSINLRESNKVLTCFFEKQSESFVLNIGKDTQNKLRYVSVISNSGNCKKLIDLFIDDKNVDVGEKRMGKRKVIYAKSYIKDGISIILNKIKRM